MLKDTIKTVKKHSTEWEKIFVNHVLDNTLAIEEMKIKGTMRYPALSIRKMKIIKSHNTK